MGLPSNMSECHSCATPRIAALNHVAEMRRRNIFCRKSFADWASLGGGGLRVGTSAYVSGVTS